MLNSWDLMAIGLVIATKSKKEEKSKLKRKWSKGWLLKRSQLSHVNLLRELRSDPNDWKNYLRMDEETYGILLNAISSKIKRQDTVMRKAITPHEKLSATLRFLATGRSYEDLKFSTIISAQCLGKIIPETCKQIYEALKGDYMKFPTTEREWKEISMQFEQRWQFPNCLGAADGKHIRIKAPPGSGSYYWNYKDYNSIVMFAICNANYEFILCDVGTNGRISDGGVIEKTKFFEMLMKSQLSIPKIDKPCHSNTSLPYVFIGDEAFTLRENFLKPFNQKELDHDKEIFNYRLSRARRIVENVFGILASRFRIFHTEINLQLDRVDLIVMTCAVLHNFLRRNCSNSYSPSECFYEEDQVTGEVTSGLEAEPSAFLELQKGTNRNHCARAKEVRELYKHYFNNEGKVEWQENMIGKRRNL